MIDIDPKRTALVLIDLQYGIMRLPTQPYPTADVLARAKDVAANFRAHNAPVVLVHVGWFKDFADAPKGHADAPSRYGSLPEDWQQLDTDLVHDGDIIVLKHQWGAFTGTDLDVQLRRRGIDHIVIGGIITNMGVESTVRHGWEIGYNMTVVEDLCSGLETELHNMAMQKILPKISRVVPCADLNFAL
ncbi:Peptidase S28 [Carpediemonas membranifera]|uniref:Peptidase S28 n=1 Tax=Carpediemonas membranifera TaxID=201153 RepID=A0A8J6AQF4_9EUKA|nr:Peptidase S28 [Carpediemonas membranifera]|eukprot:KAG9390973.1 Peptidase S28 [Carpediemonas membranifera]